MLKWISKSSGTTAGKARAWQSLIDKERKHWFYCKTNTSCLFGEHSVDLMLVTKTQAYVAALWLSGFVKLCTSFCTEIVPCCIIDRQCAILIEWFWHTKKNILGISTWYLGILTLGEDLYLGCRFWKERLRACVCVFVLTSELMYAKLRLLRGFFHQCPVTFESFNVSSRLVGNQWPSPPSPRYLSFVVSFVLFLSIHSLQGFICTSACLPFSPSLHADRGPFSTLRLLLLFFLPCYF